MVSIYDSREAGWEASRVSDVVLRELGEDVVVDRTAWELPSLEDSSSRDAAVEEAARADVIVVALSGTQPTGSLKQWAASWPGKRQLSGGLLALVPSGDSDSGGELAEFLYETAVTAKMDFLSRTRSRH